ncbi:hypothetical protein Tco_0888311 [Tanacetum coccineum]
MNDFKRNKHFPEKISSNLKLLNTLQPEWRRHVTIVHQTKDLHEADYTHLYDFLKYNQAEVNELRAERLARAHDPLALMANSNNPYNYPVFHQDQPSPVTYYNFNPQPSFNTNYMQQPMLNLEDITNPTTALNMTLVLMAKAFKLNYSTPTNNNQIISLNPCNRQIAQPSMNLGQDRQMQMVRGNRGNQFRQYGRQNVRNQNGYNATQLLIAQKEEAGIQLQAEEFDFMAAAGDLEEIEEVNANCILMANLQQASTSGTLTDSAPVYDSDGSAEVHEYDNFYNNEIFNMFTQEEQYTDLLEPIPEPNQVQHNDSNVISAVSSVEQSGGTVEQNPAIVEETHAYFESLYNNLAIEVEKVNTVNPKLRETNADLTTELARYKNQEKCFEISQEKYDKLERCYQKSVYQEQCLTKKINALHLSPGKQITTLNEKIANLNNHLSKEKSTVSSLQEEKKKLKSNFKIREEKLLDKQIQLENKIKELNNSLVKTGQSIQTMHMLSPKPDLFYHTEQKMALEAAKFVRDFKSLASKADESLAIQKALEFEIERLLRAVVSQDIMSIVQNPTIVETSDLQTELERTIERFENCIIKKENEYAKLWNDWYTNCEECKYDKILYEKAYNDMQQKIKGFQARLGDLKVSNQSTERKPSLQSLRNNYVVRQPNAFQSFPKVGETNALSNPVTSNSVPSSHESTVVNNERVIAPGIFRINPFKAPSVDNFVPNKHVKASVRTKPIIVSQPQVITKNDVNSKTDGFSPKDVKSTTRTRRPQPRNNPKSDKVPFKSKSSCLSNKKKNQSANVSNVENQKKRKPKVWKPKKVGSKERLASPKPSTPGSCLRWSPTGRMFDLKGKIITTSESECQSDCSKGKKELVFVKSSADDIKVTIPGIERPWLSKAEGFILPNHDTGRILPAESQRNTIDPSVAVTDSLVTDYDSDRTIKSILRSKSIFKAEALKGVIINEPSPALAKGTKSSSASKVHSAPAGKLKSVKIKDDPPLDIRIRHIQLSVQYSIFIQSINTAYSLLLNTAYRSSGKEPKTYLSELVN